MPLRIWRGPFRGARIVASPRASMRKVLGLYEHELNGWLEGALPRVSRLIDVGANDGYFALGCAAAFERLERAGEIICFEPQPHHMATLRASVGRRRTGSLRIDLHPLLVGREVRDGVTTLDALPTADRRNTLIKIDVEGAEIDVISGASTWLDRSNLFLIEVHRREYLAELSRMFTERGLELLRIDQRPLPVVGRELRDADNWWLVSKPGTGA